MHTAVKCVVVAALAALTVVSDPRPALGATPPTISGVATEGDPNRGDVLVSIYGTKLTVFKTVTLDDVDRGGQETISVLSHAKDRIVVRIPSDLAPGAYRFSLAPRSGDPTQIAYNVSSDTIEAGFFVGPNQALAPRTITADLSTNTFSIGTGFAASGGTALTGVVTGKSNAGPQFRFTRTPANDSIDIGQNGSGDFVIENRFDASLFTLTSAGNLRMDGGGSNNARVSVNQNQFAGTTMSLRAAAGDTGYLLVADPSGSLHFRVASFGFDLLAGDAFKPGGGAWGVTSDARLKKDVVPLTGALDTLLALRSVSFEYKDAAAIHELPGRHVGFIAQEVESVLPGWVTERGDGMKSVAPKGFESLAVAALRELRAEKDAQIRALSDENSALRVRLADLESRSTAQDARLAAVEEALSVRRPASPPPETDAAATGR